MEQYPNAQTNVVDLGPFQIWKALHGDTTNTWQAGASASSYAEYLKENARVV